VPQEEKKELWKMQQFRGVEARVRTPSGRYSEPKIRPTYSFDAGRYPVVRAGMPEGLGAQQFPELPAALPLQPEKSRSALSNGPFALTNSSAALEGNQVTLTSDQIRELEQVPQQ
jgi:hypothetical protein